MRSTDRAGFATAGLPRHARVWLDRGRWRAHLRSSHEADALAALERWIAKGRPAVARRREGGATDDCFLAIALPLAEQRARIAFVAASRAVVRVELPLTLAEAIASAPYRWRAPLGDLVVRGLRADTQFRVYGSLAWQHISGQTCMTPHSDVDLLWAASNSAQIARVLDVLTSWERDYGLRADGELLLADGSAVAWRELLGDGDRVLVKSGDGVALRPSPLRAGARMPAVEAR
jgi:phosphoribosyl-dephospho-CoA transferase